MSDLVVLERLAEPAGRDVVDIGCGGGALVRALTALGARVTGVETSEQQLAPARASGGGSGARYLVGRAQQLPLEDGSVDVAVFMRSLHHVPPDAMLPALREARRVLRPDGVVFVAEPLPEGEFFELTTLVEDERVVSVDPARASVFDARRAELAQAFARHGEPGGRPGERCFRQPMRADLLRALGS